VGCKCKGGGIGSDHDRQQHNVAEGWLVFKCAARASIWDTLDTGRQCCLCWGGGHVVRVGYKAQGQFMGFANDPQ
jgi:hypothetical protein